MQNNLEDQLSKWAKMSTEQAQKVKKLSKEKRELTETFQGKLKELRKENLELSEALLVGLE